MSIFHSLTIICLPNSKTLWISSYGYSVQTQNQSPTSLTKEPHYIVQLVLLFSKKQKTEGITAHERPEVNDISAI